MFSVLVSRFFFLITHIYMPVIFILASFFLVSVEAKSDVLSKKGCEYKMLAPGYYGGKAFSAPLEIRSKNGNWEGKFSVAYAQHIIAGCETNLRNYNGQLVGTTIRVKPGDTINLKLENLLPFDKFPVPEDKNTPHNFNVTNFHTHGLHVSPSGNSDNVLISINPQTSWDVEIKIPADHPTGTFWYHAHVHGSTALQVSSGMAGAIIVEDDTSAMSLDSIPEIKAAKEQILLLQQISYDNQGVIEGYEYDGQIQRDEYGNLKAYTQFGPGSWSKSQRMPTINGQIMPEIVLRPGEVRRWRFIHGGIRESFMVGVVNTDLPPDASDAQWVLNEVAVDGLSLGLMEGWKRLELQPGYRSDVMVKAPALKKGQAEQVYYMMDLASNKDESLLDVAEAQQVLAKIIVRGKPVSMNLPCDGKKSCAGLQKTRPHKNITDAEINASKQNVKFNIGGRICPVEGEPCLPCPDTESIDCKTRFMINEIPFSTENVRKLTLGTASEWTLDSGLVNHPFHIHVNPFQVTRKDANAQDQIIWRDTLLVMQDEPVNIRSRYERYIGKFVIHCHILDHEDQGMMQIVEVVPPGGSAHH